MKVSLVDFWDDPASTTSQLSFTWQTSGGIRCHVTSVLSVVHVDDLSQDQLDEALGLAAGSKSKLAFNDSKTGLRFMISSNQVSAEVTAARAKRQFGTLEVDEVALAITNRLEELLGS